MDIITIEQQWLKIDKHSEEKSIRLSNECKCDIYIGFDNNNNRRIILSLPENIRLDINDDVKEYISIQYFDLSSHLIITLNDDRFCDVFNAFILSIFQKVKVIQVPLIAAREIIKVYFDWSEFFTEKKQSALDLNDLLGLYGELFILHREIQKTEAKYINDLLSSWVGPYGKGHDFVFDTTDLEIKTIEFSKTDIIISSEYQLECLPGKTLDLKVIKVEFNTNTGNKLSDLINNIRDIIIEKIGDISIFLKTLLKAGVSIQNMNNYDNYDFAVKSEITFNCSSIEFPKLTISNIPEEINSLRYKLKTNLLDDFIIEQKNY